MDEVNTAPPWVSVLMAVYEPNIDWLRRQLCSLEAQSYPRLRLYVLDDGSENISLSELRALVSECAPSLPAAVEKNGENRGSNAAFAALTEKAEGEYFAYCDQDDVWLPEKLQRLVGTALETGCELVCSDMYIIDGTGRRTAESIKAVRRHHVFRSGTGLAPELLIRNFATGCTMLVRAETARAALPFCPYMVHDHYLALFCAQRGELVSLPDRLLEYRLHGDNQTALLAGVEDKESYGRIRILSMVNRLEWLREHFPAEEGTRQALSEALRWARARERNWYGKGGRAEMWKYRRFSPLPTLFELFAGSLPEGIFRAFIRAGRRNWF